MKHTSAFAIAMLLAAAPALAHVVVAPQQSASGETQVYKVRVHNEETVATTKIELEVPEGVAVGVHGKPGPGERYEMALDAAHAGRVNKITWNVDIAPGKYVELPFTATNPKSGSEIRWTVHQYLQNNVRVDWSDKPGSGGKGSITKLVAPAGSAAK